ncbi:S-acyl fatty acid synthase thioesterase, medium chain isoform X2 [Lates japonicus]|uniref:oleoyl-[acyl-carrier-protein] hydrolase n=1 Tax=Lates japonicus TaxID=270547 RepID=A0AAD3MQD9_LATJO|nr:S-acyl fatty acid synthase thioesterase, medium chain isoform X2 [Lates japonicus]
MQQIVDEVIGVLLPLLKEKPFALFGHSFGAFTSFAVADALKKLHNLEPVYIFLSGASAPYSETRITAPKRSELSDATISSSGRFRLEELLPSSWPTPRSWFSFPPLKADLARRGETAGLTSQIIHSCPVPSHVLMERRHPL